MHDEVQIRQFHNGKIRDIFIRLNEGLSLIDILTKIEFKIIGITHQSAVVWGFD